MPNLILRISPPSPELTCLEHREYMKEQLGDIPDGELEKLIEGLIEKHRGEKQNFYVLSVFPNHDIFLCAGVADVLRERHGQDYVDKLLNLRRPRTFIEKLSSLVFGTVFAYTDN